MADRHMRQTDPWPRIPLSARCVSNQGRGRPSCFVRVAEKSFGFLRDEANDAGVGSRPSATKAKWCVPLTKSLTRGPNARSTRT